MGNTGAPRELIFLIVKYLLILKAKFKKNGICHVVVFVGRFENFSKLNYTMIVAYYKQRRSPLFASYLNLNVKFCK